MQENSSGWKPNTYASRSMNDTEKRYLTVPLLGSKAKHLPPRILRFRLRLSRFSYTITHVLGKLLYTADTLSRAPSSSTLRLQDEAESMMELVYSQ